MRRVLIAAPLAAAAAVLLAGCGSTSAHQNAVDVCQIEVGPAQNDVSDVSDGVQKGTMTAADVTAKLKDAANHLSTAATVDTAHRGDYQAEADDLNRWRVGISQTGDVVNSVPGDLPTVVGKVTDDCNSVTG